MADEPENEVEAPEVEEQEADTEEQAPEAESASEDDEDDFVGFASEEAEEGEAPAPEDESSVIRTLRKKLREEQKAAAELRKAMKSEEPELGPKPRSADFDYDDDAYEAALDEWKTRKAEIEQAEAEAEDAVRKEQQAVQARADAHLDRKASLNRADYDEAEEDVLLQLSEQHKSILIGYGNSAELIYALSRDPAKLQEFSKLSPLDAVYRAGELGAQLKMNKRPKPKPDARLKGNAPTGAADKKLERLEKKAAETGNRTELIRYRKELRERAA